MLRQSQRAFTLVEILMCVLILAIASAIIVPQISSRDDLKVAAGARVLMADLIWAQNRAISTQQKQYVIFTGNSYTIWYRDSTGTLKTNTHPVNLTTYTTTFGAANSPLVDVTFDGAASFATQTAVCFDEMGTPYSWDGTTEAALTAAGTVKLICGDQKLTVSIEPYTGEASVQ